MSTIRRSSRSSAHSATSTDGRLHEAQRFHVDDVAQRLPRDITAQVLLEQIEKLRNNISQSLASEASSEKKTRRAMQEKGEDYTLAENMRWLNELTDDYMEIFGSRQQQVEAATVDRWLAPFEAPASEAGQADEQICLPALDLG